MKLVWRSLFFYSFLIASLVSLFPLASVKAQIEPDNTLGTENSQVVPDIVDGVDLINGGATRGSNLFHSFREFNINEGRGAYFSNPDGIANIFSRVTGGNPSNILGRLGVLGNANLFLINPNGIFFGRNASLDLGGSFFASTADSLVFDNNFEFSASDRAAPPLLAVNIPTGLRFRDNPGNITVQGFGQDSGLNGIDGRFVTPTLEVASGNTLALVGGNVALDGGVLQAPGGRVELGGLVAAGTVGLDENLGLSFPTDITRADISLSNLAGINAIADDFLVDGSININARNINIAGLSLLTAGLAANLGTVDTQAEDITLNATGETRIDRSRIENNVNEGTIADNSNIRITTGSLILTNESELSTSNLGSGESDLENPRVAGDIIVDASRQIAIDGGASIFSTGFFGRVFLTSANGSININNASIRATGENDIADSENSRFSSINITAPQGSVFLNTATFEASNSGAGFAGDIKVNAREQIRLVNSNISATGRAGFIFIGKSDSNAQSPLPIPDSIEIDNSILSATNSNTRFAGDIVLNARDRVSINNSTIETDGNFGRILIGKGREDFYPEEITSPREVSLNNSILSTTNSSVNEFPDTQIDAGDISIDAIESIFLLGNQSQITSSTWRFGDAGNILLTTDGSVNFERSTLFSNVRAGGRGRAGNITITAGSLSLLNGAQIQSGVLKASEDDPQAGQGNGISQVTIDIRGDVRIGGYKIDPNTQDKLRSGIFTDVESGASGNAGNIKITSQAGSIFLDDEARVVSTNTSDGFVGNVVLNARDRISINNSEIESKGNFGRILIGKSELSEETASPRIVNLTNSTLSTTNNSIEGFSDTQINAGDISIDATENISLENTSEIISDTERLGNAGNIFLTTNGTIEFDNSTLFSNIDVDGIGRAGNITIKANSLSLLNGGQVQSAINQGGQGNDISQVTIDVQGDVRIAGRNQLEKPSAIFTDVVSGASGNAGSITITSQRGSLVLDGGWLYSTNDSNSGGKAGNIIVTTAQDIRLDNQALITADNRGDTGNIILRSRDLILRRNSNIRTNAEADAAGGNIEIKTENLVAFPRENSDITANARRGSGGKVDITTQARFGIVPRSRSELERLLNTTDPAQLNPGNLPTSDITAISRENPSLSGTVDLNNPDVDPSRGLIELPENVVDPSTQIAQNPCQRGVGSEFTVTGRGGLPPSPDRTLNSDNVRVGLVAPVPSKANTATTNINLPSVNSNTQEIVPAQGWVFNNKGEVILTAYDPTNKGVERSRQNPATCTAR
ncbi:filamentous hemagglutinin N-terminal domain-containing protein [Chroococcidiopsis sp. CCNUC1]|uniref:two-partner secretion domain-containing protein n=1 Tax=Chroococcidiopsis sp. CCNUC1 TaxID=2653189 RepID=UPI00202269C8|nr:filamentous hemagglutinin N-terminal domain-containing protein [Chroococcidiopsis sp. CCNUC1]URD51811.1 filamentous hemagglutinin N-terminal domain-containing protein [Chroococcidiopsis sp. CCNUC1]